MEKMIDVHEVARMLTVSAWSIYKMIREKTIPHIKVGRRIIFRESIIHQWITDQMSKNMTVKTTVVTQNENHTSKFPHVKIEEDAA